jgi:hypothetical protein
VEWTRKFVSDIPGGDIYLRAIKPTADGGFIASGIASPANPGNNKFFITKLLPDGEVEWLKSLSDLPRSILQTFDVQVLEDGYLFLNSSNIALIKTDLSGNYLWGKQTTFPIEIEDFYSNAKPKLNPATDGGFIFRGIWGMMKIDDSGNEQWSQEFFMYPVDVLEANDGGYMAIGNGPMLGVKMSGTESPQIGIIKTDALGNSTECIYQSAYTMADVTLESDQLSLDISSMEMISLQQEMPYTDFELMVDPGCVTFLGAVDEPQNKAIDMTVYPNPSGGIFRLDLSADDALKFTHLEIYNLMGQMVFKSENPSILENGIDLSAQPDGIYYLNGIFGNRKTSVKIVIQQ